MEQRKQKPVQQFDMLAYLRILNDIIYHATRASLNADQMRGRESRKNTPSNEISTLNTKINVAIQRRRDRSEDPVTKFRALPIFHGPD
jgi:hypothetical protein